MSIFSTNRSGAFKKDDADECEYDKACVCVCDSVRIGIIETHERTHLWKTDSLLMSPSGDDVFRRRRCRRLPPGGRHKRRHT